ncbi:hypothetical protein [Actinocrispum wychmicini]|uniref:Uncharacterized protein n=1 Tax=Actinocrispum wychmicini TaxID=1213861 RepID=A0A4R2JP40_9PSEU|nr:hypothetical protein [Actinocrispum wychmicini]TCO61913.1 hypothetical protein EV192_10250 [Actinocrispum wychmicini]
MTEPTIGLSVDAFLESVRTAFDNAGQIVPWPLHVARIAPYYSDVEAVDLVRRLHTLRAKGLGPAEIVALYPSASSAKSLMLDLVPGMKDAGLPVAERLDFVDTVFAGLAERESGDVFCRDGTHRLLTDGEASEFARTARWWDATTVDGRELAQAAFALSGAAQSLVWSLHFYGWTDISFVIHGPYQVTGPDGWSRVLVVRDFFDISPGVLWPQLPVPPCRTIRLSTLHDDTDEFSIDIFNHLLHRNALLASTTATSLDVDGATVADVSAARAMSDAIVSIVRQQKKVVDGLSVRELATKFVESRYYAFRDWRAATGDSWRPPEEVYRRLRDVPLPPDPSSEPSWDELRDIFDPRLDWPATTG